MILPLINLLNKLKDSYLANRMPGEEEFNVLSDFFYECRESFDYFSRSDSGFEYEKYTVTVEKSTIGMRELLLMRVYGKGTPFIWGDKGDVIEIAMETNDSGYVSEIQASVLVEITSTRDHTRRVLLIEDSEDHASGNGRWGIHSGDQRIYSITQLRKTHAKNAPKRDCLHSFNDTPATFEWIVPFQGKLPVAMRAQWCHYHLLSRIAGPAKIIWHGNYKDLTPKERKYYVDAHVCNSGREFIEKVLVIEAEKDVTLLDTKEKAALLMEF